MNVSYPQSYLAAEVGGGTMAAQVSVKLNDSTDFSDARSHSCRGR
jgi:hypothetical protein